MAQRPDPFHMIYVGNHKVQMILDDCTHKESRYLYQILCKIQDLSLFQSYITTLKINLQHCPTFLRIMKLLYRDNNLHIAQWVREQNTPLPYKTQTELFVYACTYGHLQIIREQPLPTDNDMLVWGKAFQDTCYSGHLHVAQWLVLTNPHILSPNCITNAFTHACVHGHLHIVSWLWSIRAASIMEFIKNQNPTHTQRMFQDVCANNHLRVAKWLVQLSFMNHIIYRSENFVSICLNGRLAIAQWFWGFISKVSEDVCQRAFFVASSHGHLALAQWLWYHILKPSMRKIDTRLFENMCLYGHFHMIRAFQKYCFPVNSHHKRNEIVAETCGAGHIRLGKWLVRQWGNQVNPHVDEDRVFQRLCSNGHLGWAKMFWRSFGVLKCGYNGGFIQACRNGRIRIVQWLWRLYSTTITLQSKQEGFRNACVFDHTDIIRWLWTQCKAQDEVIFPRHFYNQLFVYMCSGVSRLETARLLWELNPTSVSSSQIFKEAFKKTCQRGNLRIMRWLWELNTTVLDRPIVRKKDLSNIIKMAKKYNHHHVMNWLSGINKK